MNARYQRVTAENEKLRARLAEAVARNSQLRADKTQLAAVLPQVKAENKRLQKRVAELEAQVQKPLSDLESAQRASKRQAAPFRKQEGPKPNPKKPGRKPGEAYGSYRHREPLSADRVDERYEIPLPECCPHCGSRHLRQISRQSQYQTDIRRVAIYRQFLIAIGQCTGCGARVQGQHPLQTTRVAVGRTG